MSVFRVCLLTAIVVTASGVTLTAAEPRPIPADQFERLCQMVKPQAGESKWMDVPWLLSVQEARQKAAAEGKPIFIWSGCGDVPTTCD